MLTDYAGNLSHPLKFGHVLEIVAKTIDGASRCNIILTTTKSVVNPNADIGLQISCLFRENCIVRNSRINDTWGIREVHTNDEKMNPLPIAAGEFFMIYILCCEDQFHISINSRPFCTYKYRLNLGCLRTIEIRDQIQVIKQVDHRTVFPIPWPSIHASDFFKAFSCDIPILFSPGHVTIITARCFGDKGQFIVKFLDSWTRREELHFNVRFDQKAVVRNTMNKNFEFGPEECHGDFPFRFNQQFKLAIGFTDREFLTAVDGVNFVSYSYRSPDPLRDMVGFKITTLYGLLMHVSGVDHVKSNDINCTGFEKYSRLHYVIN